MVESLQLGLIGRLNEVISSAAAIYRSPIPSYALLDFPSYSNIGDSAIWQGELRHLASVFQSRPSYVCDHGNLSYEALRQAVPTGPIFLTGGGNFGDLWPDHHPFRELVIGAFKDRQIVQLPQSVYFESQEALKRTAKIINDHPDFTLCVRDVRSLAIARANLNCAVHLVPDMAFCLGAIERPVAPRHQLLLLLRTDIESARGRDRGVLPLGCVATDWLEEDADLSRRLIWRTALSSPFKRGRAAFSRGRYRDWLYEGLAEARLNRGLKLVSSAEYVITDRLHCHILCVLLGIPHSVLDNSYGKLGSFIETWTRDYPLLRVATSLEEAFSQWKAASK